MIISEIFYSLQGEGRLTGRPSLFIRTAGCNLACNWCDTAYARHPAAGSDLTLEAIMAQLAAWPQADHCVITGGEPTLQPEALVELTQRLAPRGFHITIETNATNPPPAGLVCHLASLSPKLHHAGPQVPPPDPATIRRWLAGGDHQLKLVCAGRRDLPQILALKAALGRALAPDALLLMPLTLPDAAASRICRDEVVQLCLEYGFSYAYRLHLELFEGRRGT